MKNKYARYSYRYLFVWNPLETDLFPSCLKHYFKLNLVLKIQKYNLQDFSQLQYSLDNILYQLKSINWKLLQLVRLNNKQIIEHYSALNIYAQANKSATFIDYFNDYNHT